MVWGNIVLQFIAILFISRPNFCSHNVNFTRDVLQYSWQHIIE